MSRFARLGQRLYDGRTSVDFVGRRAIWYAVSTVIVLIALSGLIFRGLNFGIEFEGGVEYRVTATSGQAGQQEVEAIREAVADTGIPNASAPVVNTSGDENIRVQTEPLTNDEAETVAEAIQEAAGVGPDNLSRDAIGATWGQQVADRALIGLGVFLVLVTVFIWVYFREWKMSVGALVALAHDLVITIGVYALSGFEVTPATVTGILTILGFSLYDTVVVFDKVRENTRDLARGHRTYREAANLAVNQTLVRSINTSIVALLPVAALLYVGVVNLGSGALKDLALALFVGMAAGLYSSVFIATPLVVQLKEREPGVRAGDARAVRRQARPVDPFATVPAFSEDMPIYDEAGDTAGRRGPGSGATAVLVGQPDDDDETQRESGSEPDTGPVPARAPRYTAGERPASKPVTPSASAKREQPERRPRSRRGRK